jgi:aspartate/methionine/tyrosine aminotransferase
MRETFERRRDLIVEMLGEIRTPAGETVSIQQPEGAFYAFVDVNALLGIPLGKGGDVANSAEELSRLLLDKVLVATVPMDSFGIAGHLRFSYALSEADIAEGLRRITEFLGEAS